MTCEEVERDELIERYVLGRLEQDQQEAFEDHYFNCALCLERLRVVEDTRAELAARTVGARPHRWRRVAAALAAAAVVVLAIRVGQDVWNDPPPPPSSRPSADVVLPAPPRAGPAQPAPELGDIELPRYAPPRLRATTTDAQRLFRDAMASYAAGNCDEAVTGLRRSLAMDDALTPARFYLALCDLQGGRIPEAVANLRRVIALGESPYLEDAHFFLAKAHIRQGELTNARGELTRVVSLRGDRRAEAERLLDQLR